MNSINRTKRIVLNDEYLPWLEQCGLVRDANCQKRSLQLSWCGAERKMKTRRQHWGRIPRACKRLKERLLMPPRWERRIARPQFAYSFVQDCLLGNYVGIMRIGKSNLVKLDIGLTAFDKCRRKQIT